MQIPDFKVFREWNRGAGFARRVHPNPRFYKYYWWIFHEGSPCDGEAFLGDEFRLATREAIELMDRLDAEGKPYWTYNRKLPRADLANTPWDFNSHAWEGQEWAPPFDADPDPIHPNGHR